MSKIFASGIMAASALAIFALSGCVTETVPAPELHTSAYVSNANQPDPPSLADEHSSSSASGTASSPAGAAPPVAAPPPVAAAPPIPGVPPPPVLH